MESRYKKLRKLGSGGFGEVWMTERIHDKRQFATKYLLATDAESIARFQREVRCLSQLDHPNIVRVRSKSLTVAPYWYAMKPYKGSLYDELPGIVGKHDRIHLVLRSILDAVRYAHNEGVIHRDIKPENVLMNSDTDLVLSDFGLGRILDTKSTRMTIAGTRLGTVFYCAPEQVRDFKSADRRSDIFSLGRLLYELYSGELSSAVQDLSSIPASIAAIVERATSTNPDHRYQTVDKMMEEFEATMEVILGIVEAGSLDDLIERLRVSKKWTDEDLAQLSIRLEEIADEGDIVHTALMKVPPELFARLARRSKALARKLVRAFAIHVQSQSWPFSYTDEIADVASALSDVLPDSQMKAELFEAVLTVGVGHSRWHVMSVAAQFLHSAQEPDEVVALAKVLREHPSEAGYMSSYVTRSELHKGILPLIPKHVSS